MKMNTSKILTLSALLAGSALQAADVTWTAGTFDNAGPASVLNAENIVYAGNVGSTSQQIVNVSGTNVTFEANDPTFGGSNAGKNFFVNNASSVIVTTSPASFGSGDSAWDAIMDASVVRVLAGGALQLDLQNLADGQEYQIQMFAWDSNNSGNRTTVFSDAATGGNAAAELRFGDKDYVVGTFTASGSTQSIFAQTGSFATNTSYISAFALTTIPEPGTYALIGGLLALSSVMVRRRR